MNPILETPKPVSSHASIKEVLSRHGVTASLIAIDPSSLFPGEGGSTVHQDMLFLIDGEATVGINEVNTILQKEDALLVPAGAAYTVSTGAAATKMLKVVIPLPLPKDPPIHLFDS